MTVEKAGVGFVPGGKLDEGIKLKFFREVAYVFFSQLRRTGPTTLVWHRSLGEALSKNQLSPLKEVDSCALPLANAGTLG